MESRFRVEFSSRPRDTGNDMRGPEGVRWAHECVLPAAVEYHLPQARADLWMTPRVGCLACAELGFSRHLQRLTLLMKSSRKYLLLLLANPTKCQPSLLYTKPWGVSFTRSEPDGET